MALASLLCLVPLPETVYHTILEIMHFQ